MNLKTGKIEAFEQFSLFQTLKEFNSHMEMWMLEYKDQFSKGELVGLKRLARFAAKVPGVCNAKIGTMLKAIHEEYNGNGISRSTFKRMILKAKELGIITVCETVRKNGSQSSNLYVFNRFPTNEPPKKEELGHPKTSNLLKISKKDLKKRNEEPFELDYTFTNDRVPTEFVQLVKCFYADAKTIEEYWKMASIAAYRNNREKEAGMVAETAIHSFKQLICNLKLNRAIQNPIAYFYGIMNKKLEELYFEELFQMGF